MTAPDPVAALRNASRLCDPGYVACGQHDGDRADQRLRAVDELVRSLPDLSVYVERLEAALVAFTTNLDAQTEWGSKPHECDSFDVASCPACDEIVRLHVAEQAAEKQILVLGRELRERSRG